MPTAGSGPGSTAPRGTRPGLPDAGAVSRRNRANTTLVAVRPPMPRSTKLACSSPSPRARGTMVWPRGVAPRATRASTATFAFRRSPPRRPFSAGASRRGRRPVVRASIACRSRPRMSSPRQFGASVFRPVAWRVSSLGVPWTSDPLAVPIRWGRRIPQPGAGADANADRGRRRRGRPCTLCKARDRPERQVRVRGGARRRGF